MPQFMSRDSVSNVGPVLGYHGELYALHADALAPIDGLDVAIRDYDGFGPAPPPPTGPTRSRADPDAPPTAVEQRLFEPLREYAYRKFVEDAGKVRA